MDFKFAEKKEIKNNILDTKWKILIADDDEDIHSITKLALKEFEFDNKIIEFFDAYNGLQTIEILQQNPDIDLILLDVVMDSDDDGLKTTKIIREQLKNKNVRIILRTGQPGYAPEKEIIVNYDIDDYKEKTELTSSKLFTAVVGALRTSKHLKNIEKNREGLANIIEASKSIFKLGSLLQFTDGVLIQLGTIIKLTHTEVYKNSEKEDCSIKGCEEVDCFFATVQGSHFQTLSASGKFRDMHHTDVVSPESLDYLNKAFLDKKSFFVDDVYVGFFHSLELDRIIFLYMEGCKFLNENDKKILEVFSNNISIAFENICLVDKEKQMDIQLSQQSKMATMGEMIENIAHQWRQPLSAITTSASGMKMQKEYNLLTDEQFYTSCDSIVDSSEYLSHTIDDFKDFFKLDKMKTDFKIKDVVSKALHLLSAKLEKKKIKIIENISDVKIHGLNNEFIQVLLIIINNAIDALEENKIKERILLIDDTLNDETTFCLSIKDNAGGIPEDSSDNIFNQYFTTKSHKNGTGIGLYMAKHMIEEHMKGTITVDNEEFQYEDQNYKGACFKIIVTRE